MTVYNTYVLGIKPIGGNFTVAGNYTMTPWTSGPMAVYLANSGATNYDQVRLDILKNLNFSTVPPGTRIYAGYGTSSDEMIASGRYRLIISL